MHAARHHLVMARLPVWSSSPDDTPCSLWLLLALSSPSTDNQAAVPWDLVHSA